MPLMHYTSVLVVPPAVTLEDCAQWHLADFWKALIPKLPVGEAFVMRIERDEEYSPSRRCHILTYSVYIETQPCLPGSPLGKQQKE